MKTFDEDDFIDQISKTGEAFANDYNDGLYGKFGFSIGRYDKKVDAYPLTACWTPELDDEDDEAEDGGSYGPAQVQRFWLVPMTLSPSTGKHEKASADE
jgi:hypothetical protein